MSPLLFDARLVLDSPRPDMRLDSRPTPFGDLLSTDARAANGHIELRSPRRLARPDVRSAVELVGSGCTWLLLVSVAPKEPQLEKGPRRLARSLPRSLAAMPIRGLRPRLLLGRRRLDFSGAADSSRSGLATTLWSSS